MCMVGLGVGLDGLVDSLVLEGRDGLEVDG